MSGFAPRRWIWVRHAPVPGTPAWLGWEDAAADLSDGPALAAVSARLPAEAVWISSDLSRAAETARALGAPEGFERAAALREQNFGDWEGRGPEGAAAEAFWRAPGEVAPPGGEAFSDLCARVAEFVSMRNAQAEGPFVAVAHAGVARAAVAQALGLAPMRALSISVAPLSITELVWHGPPDAQGLGGGWAVERVNA